MNTCTYAHTPSRTRTPAGRLRRERVRQLLYHLLMIFSFLPHSILLRLNSLPLQLPVPTWRQILTLTTRIHECIKDVLPHQRMQADRQARTCTQAHRRNARPIARAHVRTHTRTHACTHACMHARTHARTHACRPAGRQVGMHRHTNQRTYVPPSAPVGISDQDIGTNTREDTCIHAQYTHAPTVYELGRM